MDKGKLKTIFLVCLILISIFQTGELWFGSLSSRNFFYNLWAKDGFRTESYSGEPIYLLQPRRVIINFGVEGGVYNIIKNTREEFKTARDQMTQILTHAFSEGEFVREEVLDWKRLLTQKAMLYQYSGVIPTEGLISGQNKILSKIPKFDQIIVVPNKSTAQKMNCYFIDEEQGKVYVIAIKRDSTVLHDLIEKFREDNTQIVYISTKQRNMNQFPKNIFLPTFNSPPVYQKIIVEDPVTKEGVVDEQKLEKIVNPLFTNPTLKRKEKEEDGATYYIEGSIVVKYFPFGVIEYTNQSTSEINRQMSFIEAYQIAKGFLDKHQTVLDKDHILDNPLYLSGQRKTNAGWEFYFDFRLQDIPYVFSREIREKVNMSHAVKMIVEDKKVKLYRRLTWEGQLSDEEREVNISYPQALGEVISSLHAQGVEQVQIDDMYWAYYQKELNVAPEVYWMVSIGDQLYPIRASQ